jgi:repressor LexA
MQKVSLLIPKNTRPLWTVSDIFCATEENSLSDLVSIPLLGTVTAGRPIECIEDKETIKVPANMVQKNTYALKVSGHSMIDDNVQDGDIVIIEKKVSAENGQSVIALINNHEVTLKKFYIEADGIRLQPANPDMDAIILKNDEIEILGIVTGVIRKYED